MRPTQVIPNPRANSNLKRTRNAPKSVIKKESKRAAPTENNTMIEDDELLQLRDQLMETHNLEDINLTKLVRLQQSMDPFIQNCFQSRLYAQAKEAQQLNDELRSEIARQAQILDEHRSKMRALQNYKNVKKPLKYVSRKYNRSQQNKIMINYVKNIFLLKANTVIIYYI